MDVNSLAGLLHGFLNQLVSGQVPQLGAWDYLLLALLGLTQGYLVAVLGGVAAVGGFLNPWLVFVSISLAHLTTDNLWYFLGRFWNVDRILRYGRSLGMRQEYVERVDRGMNSDMEKIILLSKLTSGLTIPVIIAAGVARLPWTRAFAVMVLGEGIRTGVLVFLGYWFALSMRQVEGWLQVIALLGGVLVLWIVLYYLRKHTNLMPRK